MALQGASSAQVFRYLLIGGLAWLTDFAIFALCLASTNVVFAQLCARIAGGAVGFFGHKLFVFREGSVHPAMVASQTLRYAALWLLSYVVSTLALIGLIEHAGLNATHSKVMVETGIVVMNYLVMKRFIFQHSSEGAGE